MIPAMDYSTSCRGESRDPADAWWRCSTWGRTRPRPWTRCVPSSSREPDAPPERCILGHRSEEKRLKGFLLVADSARIHGDGTFSLLRGGIDRVLVPEGEPLIHRGSVVARLFGDTGEAGKHEFSLRIETGNGEVVAPELKAQFEIPVGGGGSVAALDFGFVLTKPGWYKIALSVGGKELDFWRVDVQRVPVVNLAGAKK